MILLDWVKKESEQKREIEWLKKNCRIKKWVKRQLNKKKRWLKKSVEKNVLIEMGYRKGEKDNEFFANKFLLCLILFLFCRT